MEHERYTVERLPVGQLKANAYTVVRSGADDLVIIDPGDDAQYIIDHVQRTGAVPSAILLTHGHFDHCMAAFELQMTYGIPVALHRDDQFLLERMRETASHFLGYHVVEPPPSIALFPQNGTPLSVGSYTVTVMHCPGHTPGSVAYGIGESLFTGDTVFADGETGDWRHSYSDKRDLDASVGHILSLPYDTVLYPGHGEETTVGRELAFRKLGPDAAGW